MKQAKLLSFFLFIALVTMSLNANAWYKKGIAVCNGVEEEIEVAFALKSESTGRSLGWVKLTEQECLQLYKQEVSKLDKIYLYAKGNEKVWNSNANNGETFCIQSEENFNLTYPVCQNEGYSQVYFIPVPVNGRPLVEYTFK